ncbi:hypothetical protein [Helicobacter sp. MIT 14-3879]|uniref:hypothetical protein n=1 Tax=Helicobacter sp. MIT 14-3879 TaxID=2040649 RepID=UPI000E1EEA96|nr:hypothetical protein [Helicobacter sp. MIT 14-3879]RDU64809.1 hypothetical protein CQA44_03620 [Helicobacter sp. MIT 14-3879]
MRLLLIGCLLFCNLFGAWVMFNDGEDTYIYNNISGDIYIRHKKGGNNYEDQFIKMPSGVIPKNLQDSKSDPNSKKPNIDKKGINSYNNDNISEQTEALKNKFQDLQNNMLDKVLE